MNNPLVSVIVPVYNAELTLNRCVDSILSQRDVTLELILVDDGSSDASGSIIDSYLRQDNRVSVVHKSNGGVGSARNIGLNKAKGMWVTFVDSDDWVSPGYFSRICICENADLIIMPWRINGVDDKASAICGYGELKLSGDSISEFYHCHGNDIVLKTPWAKFFKRSLLEENRIVFDTEIKLGEDTLFMLDYMKHCSSIVSLSHSIYTYYDHSSKYLISIDEALRFMDSFWTKYKKLEMECPTLVRTILVYIWSRVDGGVFMKIRWNLSRSVVEMKSNVYDEIPFPIRLIKKLYRIN